MAACLNAHKIIEESIPQNEKIARSSTNKQFVLVTTNQMTMLEQDSGAESLSHHRSIGTNNGPLLRLR
jgi:hypothetical protein